MTKLLLLNFFFYFFAMAQAQSIKPAPGNSFPKKPGKEELMQLRKDIQDGKKTVNDVLDYLKSNAGYIPSPSWNSFTKQPEMVHSMHAGNTATDSIFHLTKDINTIKSSHPGNYTSVRNGLYDSFAVKNKIVYFSADDGIHGIELWRSDGTAEGTYMVKDIAPGEISSSPSEITTVNNKIFFRVGLKNLWVSDGTTTGTHLIKTIPGFSDAITSFFAAGNNLFFVNSNNGILNQLWKSDGTVSGTQLVYDDGAGNAGYGISHFAYLDGILYFTKPDYTYGYELWRTNGTTAGTRLVEDLNPGNDDNYGEGPGQLTIYNGRLYFTQDDGTSRKLWVLNEKGTNAVHPKGYSSITIQYPYYLFNTNVPFPVTDNVLYFIGSTPETGNELYKYDTLNGQVLVKDITPGTVSTDFTVFNGMVISGNALYFSIWNSNAYRYELWKSKGKSNNTVKVKAFDSYIYYLFDVNGTLIFNAYDSLSGGEPWKSDGTEQGTTLLKDINPGKLNGQAYYLTATNNKFFFASTDTKGTELWISDATTAGTQQVKDINRKTTGSSFGNGIATSFGLLFSAYTNDYGSELYKSDGTNSGTKFIKDMYPGENSSGPRYFINKNTYTYFYASNSIYRTNGTAAGTKLICSAINSDGNYTVTDEGLVVYVVNSAPSYKFELWRSDGTVAGTYMLLNEFNGNNPVAAVGNIVFSGIAAMPGVRNFGKPMAQLQVLHW